MVKMNRKRRAKPLLIRIPNPELPLYHDKAARFLCEARRFFELCARRIKCVSGAIFVFSLRGRCASM